jgi:flagellum-specific ATP synthase
MLDLIEQLERVMPTALSGSVVRTVGMTAAVADFPAPVGALVEIERHSAEPLRAEVIGFRDALTVLYPFSELKGVRRGNRVRLVGTARWLRVGEELLGRVVNAQGHAIDGRPQPALAHRIPLDRAPPPSVERPRIDTPLGTGIRALDGLLTCGKGQRMGIFAGSGVGKSVLLGMMARYTSADVNVIALVGERGREVNEFLERDLGAAGLARSVVVVATSDEPALMRIQAAQTATAIAEFFRDSGRDVLLIMDSLTRFAMAQREIGLAAGEPPTTRGYPPSVFAMLPKLVERAGQAAKGSITGFYSVLVEGDDPQEPISDTVRGLLDGHTWLSRKMAARGHYPAIDILNSISRLATDITPRQQQDAAQSIRELLSAYRDHEDLISIGAYRRGANRAVDAAIEMQDEINRYLRQRIDEPVTIADAAAGLSKLHHRAATQMQAGNPVVAPATTVQQQNA